MKKMMTSLCAAALLLSATSVFAATQPACVADLQANRPSSTATDAEKQAYRDAVQACRAEVQAARGK